MPRGNRSDCRTNPGGSLLYPVELSTIWEDWRPRPGPTGSSFPAMQPSARKAGFAAELAEARLLRRQWFLAQGFAAETAGGMVFSDEMLDALRRQELLRVASQLSSELEMPFREAGQGDTIEGVYRRAVDLVSGRHTLIERSWDFTLAPWRRALERQVGKTVSGLVRADGVNWTAGRGRPSPGISSYSTSLGAVLTSWTGTEQSFRFDAHSVSFLKEGCCASGSVSTG